MRVGVFGGTFDPPHIGHLAAAEEARVRLDLERVVFVPAGVPPHKLDGSVTSSTHRVEMITRAVASNPHFCVSLVDVERPGPSYTVRLLRALRDLWEPDTTIYFIMGVDSLVDLPNWQAPEQLVKLCRLAVVERPGYHADMEALAQIIPGLERKVDRVPMPLLDISSTELRNRVRSGQTIRYYVPPEVEAYVQAYALYS